VTRTKSEDVGDALGRAGAGAVSERSVGTGPDLALVAFVVGQAIPSSICAADARGRLKASTAATAMTSSEPRSEIDFIPLISTWRRRG
jgi:hypothetical protein